MNYSPIMLIIRYKHIRSWCITLRSGSLPASPPNLADAEDFRCFCSKINHFNFSFGVVWLPCVYREFQRGFCMRYSQTVFFVAQVFLEKYSLGEEQRKIFSKSRLRLNLGYEKNRLTFAYKNLGSR